VRKTWAKGIVGVKRADRRKMEALRVEDGVKESYKIELVSSRLKWASRVERMRIGNLAESRCQGS